MRGAIGFVEALVYGANLYRTGDRKKAALLTDDELPGFYKKWRAVQVSKAVGKIKRQKFYRGRA